MSRVALVTDSTHYLPREFVAEHDISVVSLYVNWDGRTDRESDLLDLDGYYSYLGSSEDLPTTSQPSVGDFVAVYEPLLEAGREIVSVHLSAGISGTYDSASAAKAKLEEESRGGERITLVDSKTTCGGMGMLLLAGSAAAQDGATREQVEARVAEARAALKIWFCVDTMEFLRRGGRVGAARAWLGSTLKIKPILTLESEITPIERVRTAKRAFERMAEYLEEREADGADGWVVQHIQAPDQADAMVERGRALFGSEPLFVSEVGPVIGTHVGPGLLGVGGIPRALMRPQGS